MSGLSVLDPATEEVIAELPSAGVEELDAAVARARARFPAWSQVAPSDRARLLRAIGTAIEIGAEELAQSECRNAGKPIRDARDEVALVAELFHYYAGAVDKVGGRTIPVDGGVAMTFPEPLGVVGLITPWNFPLAIASWKLAPALACGNTVVLKPAELTPLTALMLERLALEAGLPEGVLNVVVGPGRVVGQRLAEHPDVARIGFTGSTVVGRGVMAAAAGTIKRVTLELGGKSANVVFADADLEQAAAQAPGAIFGNAGQDCCARSRILVERPAFERFLELFVAATEAYVVGDPCDEGTQMGPLISAGQRERVASYVPEQVTYAKPLPDRPGFWFPPTILTPASATDRVVRDEIFGPVAAVLPFDDEEGAVRLANDTPYGLSGSVWTKDGARALRMARALECGALSINSNTSLRVSTPFGGFKQSGFGRELGLAAMKENTELKTVFYSTTP
jgi:betaine-aldehyde dehydrogenase